VHGRHSLGRTTSLTPRLQLFTVEQQTSHTFSTPYTTTVQIMPVVEASTASSKTIAALFAIPIVILFLCIWLAVSCSERWNKSDNRVKRYLERKKLRPRTMAFYTDDDVTPRPLRFVNPDEWAERSPYIPRRKSSNNEDSVQAASVTDVRRSSRVHQHENNPRDRYVQKARFPIDGYDPVSKTLTDSSLWNSISNQFWIATRSSIASNSFPGWT
jgi:hypothetical protein